MLGKPIEWQRYVLAEHILRDRTLTVPPRWGNQLNGNVLID
ncbi:hypothetical protein [Trichocoleus sp. FACHB-591]|nr:hypothetical protein [Trichocoleus sp. FACHB-591]